MIKNKLLMGVASGVIMLSLAACNNNGDNAFDFDRDNRYGTLNNQDDDGRRNRDDNRILRNRDERDDNGILRNRDERDDDRFDGLNISADRTTLSSKSFPHTKAVLIQEAKYKYVTTGPEQGNRGRQANQGRQENRGRYGTRHVPQQGIQGQIIFPQLNLGLTPPREWAQPAVPAPAPTAPAPAPAAPTRPAPAAPAPAPNRQAPAPAAPAPAKTPATAPNQAAPRATAGVSQAQARVIELTNAQRRQNGLPELKADTQLNSVAQRKSVDMMQNNYFSHTSPTYGSPFDMMRDFGVTYNTAGENIAQGQKTPEQVVDSWMKSPGHRQNILNPKFTHIGVGYEPSGHHWTQMFIGR